MMLGRRGALYLYFSGLFDFYGKGEGELAGQGNISGLADRYAAALYELAEENKALDQTANQLRSVKKMIDESADLRRLIGHPLMKREDQMRAMMKVLQEAKMDDLIVRFVGLVATNRRLMQLPSIIQAFLKKLSEARGEVTAYVTSATPLLQEHVQKLTDILQKSQGGKVDIEANVDPELLGGIVVRLGSRMIDASLKTKLNKLQVAMKGI